MPAVRRRSFVRQWESKQSLRHKAIEFIDEAVKSKELPRSLEKEVFSLLKPSVVKISFRGKSNR
jgi:hypothetical protein